MKVTETVAVNQINNWSIGERNGRQRCPLTWTGLGTELPVDLNGVSAFSEIDEDKNPSLVEVSSPAPSTLS